MFTTCCTLSFPPSVPDLIFIRRSLGADDDDDTFRGGAGRGSANRDMRAFRTEEARIARAVTNRSAIESNLVSRKNARILMRLTCARTPASSCRPFSASRSAPRHVQKVYCTGHHTGRAYPNAPLSPLAIRRGSLLSRPSPPLPPCPSIPNGTDFRNLGRLRAATKATVAILNEGKK